MRLIWLLLVLAPSASAQLGWQQLGDGTILHFVGTHDVCPPNNYNGIPFAFNDTCPAVLTDWGGAALDTLRARLIFWGGGHNVSIDNSLYALNMSGTPEMVYLTRPGAVAAAQTIQTTDTPPQPVSRHTYDCVVYAPVADKVFGFDGIAYGGGSPVPATWLADVSLSTPTWAKGTDYPFAGSSSVTGASCIVDPTTADETILVLQPVSAYRLSRYNVTTNAWTLLNSSIVGPIGTPVIDPVRKLLFLASNGGGGSPANNHLWKIDIAPGSSFTATDIYSSTTGCSSWLTVVWPGAIYDPVTTKIVGWPNTGDTVYEFDYSTLTCTARTFTGGPTADAATLANGIHSRFAYFASLGKYVVVANPTVPAYTLTLNIVSPTSISTTSPITAGTHGTPYTFTFAVTGNLPADVAATWTKIAGALPPGLTLSSGGVLSGTPTLAGTYTFTLSATNGGIAADPTKQFQMTVLPLCQITSVPFPGGVVNAPYSQTVTTTECASPSYAVTSGTLPTGLTLHSGSGIIDGTPTVTGLYSFTVTVTTTDGSGSPSQPFTALIVAGPGPSNIPVCSGCLIRL